MSFDHFRKDGYNKQGNHKKSRKNASYITSRCQKYREKRAKSKNVPDGYARNFLLAKKLATVATAAGVAQVKHEEEKRKANEAQAKQGVQQLADAVNGKVFTIKARAKDGKLFGSITQKEIALEIRKSAGLAIPEKAIEASHLKELGEKKVKINFDFGIVANILLNIEQA